MEKKRNYGEARLRVVHLSGKTQLLAGSDAGGGSSPSYHPAAGATLSAMGVEGTLE